MRADIETAVEVLAEASRPDGAHDPMASVDVNDHVAAVGVHGSSGDGDGLLVALFHRNEREGPWQLAATSFRETETVGGLIYEAAEAGPEPVWIGAIEGGPGEVDVYVSSAAGQDVTVSGRSLFVSLLGFVVMCR